ncbi:MAG TPA: alpha/beta fold hydrolase [Thermomicrobiales bacterium]|jgi:pimeloyl-ACP methyl ester carboxylesterase
MVESSSLGPYREVRLPSGTVRYREAGSGPPIVFVHGLLVNGDLWRRVVPLLSGEFRCIAPDLPLGGHLPAMPADADLSPPGLARIVADFLAALDLRGVHLVGSDTGGAISQLVIAEHPERIARLALTNCDAYEHFPPPLVLPFKWGAFVPGFAAALAGSVRFLPPLGRLLYALLAHHNPGRATLDGYFSPLIRDGGVRRDLTKAMRAVAGHHTLKAARAFPGFRKPVLIVWGDDDFVFPRRDAERLRRDFPDARLVPVAHARAFVSEDQPERLAALLADFLRETRVMAA